MLDIVGLFPANKIFYKGKDGILVCGDCLELMQRLPDKCVDLVLTDPPYPDQHAELYNYHDGIIDFLKDLNCRQLIFWSAKVEFPLDYTAIHIWDKLTGCASQYQRIFERGGNREYKIFNYMNIFLILNYNEGTT